jgi:hypothetical protein
MSFEILKIFAFGILHLNKSFNEPTFEYSFPREFLDTNCEIGMVKFGGTLVINK